jgi:uncharacterized protein YggE
MKRTAILVAALVLLPISAAGAQMEPVQRVPMTSVPPNAQQHGITVTGSGSTRIPATSAKITLQLASANRSLTLDKATLAPLVDALVKAGVDRANVHFPLSLDAPGGATNYAAITVIVAHPTAALMQSGIVTVGATVASMKDVVLNGAQVQLTAEHCQDALDTARQQAIARARAKAESIAKDLDVHVGPAINVNSMEANYPDGSCLAQYYINPMGSPGDQSTPQTAQDYVTVPATANISITYAIK